MTETLPLPEVKSLIVGLTNINGNIVEEEVIVEKMLYRSTINHQQLLTTFGSDEIYVCTTVGDKETHRFHDLNLAIVCARRLSPEGPVFVAVRYQLLEHKKPLVLLSVFYKNRPLSYAKVAAYMDEMEKKDC